jgi:hypothetical protein
VQTLDEKHTKAAHQPEAQNFNLVVEWLRWLHSLWWLRLVWWMGLVWWSLGCCLAGAIVAIAVVVEVGVVAADALMGVGAGHHHTSGNSRLRNPGAGG